MADQAPHFEQPGLNWQQQRVLLATVHRRENWGERLAEIGAGFLQLLERYPDTALLLPLHRNPTVREPLQAFLGSHPRAFLTEPLDYDQLVAAMRGGTLVLIDPGGLQEEAAALGKPVLVQRRTTERLEAADAGTIKLIYFKLLDVVTRSTLFVLPLESSNKQEVLTFSVNLQGDESAANRIVHLQRQVLIEGPTHSNKKLLCPSF